MSERTRAAEQAAKIKTLEDSQAEATQLGPLHPWEVRLDLDELACLSLVGTLQLALRHPQFQTKPTGHFMRQLVTDLIGRIPPERPALRKLALMGFNQSFDDVHDV